MAKNYIEDVLSLQADQLIAEQETQNHLTGNETLADETRDRQLSLSHSPDGSHNEELVSLFNLAKKIRFTLSPVSPMGNFQAKLKQDLLTKARLRHAEQEQVASHDLLIFTALLGFLVSLAGLFVAKKRWREQVTFALF